MGLKVGGADVADVKLGAIQVVKVMVGTTQVWPTAPAGPQILGKWEHVGIKGATSIHAGMMGAQTNGLYFVIAQIDHDGATTPSIHAGDVIAIDGNQLTVTHDDSGGGRQKLQFAEIDPIDLANSLTVGTIYDVEKIS